MLSVSTSRHWFATLFRSPLLHLAVRVVLGGVYMVAGGLKLMDVPGFAIVIAQYGIVPVPLLGWVALLLPLAEVLAGAGLVFRVRGSLGAVTGMTLLFLAVLGYAIWTGLSIGDCGCFSPGEIPAGHGDGSALREAFMRDLLLLAGAMYLHVRPKTGPSGGMHAAQATS